MKYWADNSGKGGPPGEIKFSAGPDAAPADARRTGPDARTLAASLRLSLTADVQ